MATLKQIEYLSALKGQHPDVTAKHLGDKEPSTLSQTQATRALDAIKDQVKRETGHFAGTQRAIIIDALRRYDGNISQARLYLQPHVGEWKGLVFSRNSNGERIPLPLPAQIERFRTLLKQIHDEGQWRKKDQKGEDKLNQKGEVPKDESPFQALKRQVRDFRRFCEQRKADGHPLDEIGLRPLEFGLRMLEVGIPMAAILDAITMHWPKEARNHFGIKKYDVTKFKKKDRVDGIHAAYPYVRTLADARIPIALVGPKGTGKTTLASQLAEQMGLPFGFISMTSGTSPSAFNGRPKIGGDGGVVKSVWTKIYGETGGVFLKDEMDAADENLLMMVNAALANGFFSNTATGDILPQHKDFIPVCGMNTLGLGAGRDYTSRNKLDAATLDRWNCGRVRIELDERIEDTMVANVEKRVAERDANKED